MLEPTIIRIMFIVSGRYEGAHSGWEINQTDKTATSEVFALRKIQVGWFFPARMFSHPLWAPSYRRVDTSVVNTLK
jgi:hypothetical protein